MSHHIEASQLICRAIQLTGFLMMGTLVGFLFSDPLRFIHILRRRTSTDLYELDNQYWERVKYRPSRT